MKKIVFISMCLFGFMMASLFGVSGVNAEGTPLETAYAFLHNKLGKEVRLGMTEDEVFALFPKSDYEEDEFGFKVYEARQGFIFKNNKLDSIMVTLPGLYMNELGNKLGFPHNFYSRFPFGPNPAMKGIVYHEKESHVVITDCYAPSESDTESDASSESGPDMDSESETGLSSKSETELDTTPQSDTGSDSKPDSDSDQPGLPSTIIFVGNGYYDTSVKQNLEW